MNSNRVLHLIPSLAHGGAERQLSYLSQGLTDRGWEVHIASLTGGLFRERLVKSGAILHTIRAHGNFDPFMIARIHRLIRAVEPRVVQTWLPMMDVLGSIVARTTGTPWILSERSTAVRSDAPLKLYLRGWLGRRASAVVSNSVGGSAYWEQQLPPATPRYVIRNALPLAEIEAALPADPASLGLDGSPLLLSVGRFDHGKNVMGVIDAFARSVPRAPVQGLILGEGVQFAQAQDRIAALGLSSRILAPGIVQNVFSWMKRASVLVSLSRFEGMPNAVMEAMAVGCPVVVSDIPAHREILDDDTALWVSPDDPAAAAQAILALLSDAKGAHERAIRARARVGEWSIASLADAHARVYDRVAPRGDRA